MDIRVLDLFCGGGGSSCGARSAGVQIACGVDEWDVALSIYARNFGPVAHRCSISADSDPADLRHFAPFDLILASPECTNHTCARGNRPKNEESRLTASHVLNYVRHYHPRWVILENVVHMRSWDRYSCLLEALRELGYNTLPQVLDSSLFGVPQTRKRLFILCDHEAKPDPVIPPGTFPPCPVPASSILDPPGTWRTNLLYSPERAPNTLARAERAMAELAPDEDFLLVYYGSDSAGGWQRLDRPLRTLTTLDRFGLVERNSGRPTLRMLQVPELKRAMGLPSDYVLEAGTRRDRIKLLGNGVCPPVMKAVVETLTAKR